MRYFYWFYIHEIYLYPFNTAIVLPFYFLFGAEWWVVAALIISLCLLCSILAAYVGRLLRPLTAANILLFASKGQLNKALNQLIYLSRFLPAIRSQIREYCFHNRELNKEELMGLAARCAQIEGPSLKPFLVFRHVLYAVGLVLAIAAIIMRLIG